MRQIKVRAWDKENKRWYDGCEGAIGWSGGKIFQNNGKLSFNAADGGKGLEFVLYTGLKDKNGVEIYEGDIVKYSFFNDMLDDYSRNVIEPVEFDMTFYGYQPFVSSGDDISDIEVIGNIYENPELVKEVV